VISEASTSGDPTAPVTVLHLVPDATSEWAGDVLRGLGTLDGVTAAALVGVYRDRHSQAQVAVTLSLPESEVRTRLSTGLRQLGRLLTLDGNS
jgi:DNA-directed RNA polymerase specialized sigma24 family protein